MDRHRLSYPDEAYASHEMKDSPSPGLPRYSGTSLEGSRTLVDERAHRAGEHESSINLTNPLLPSIDASRYAPGHDQQIESEEVEANKALDRGTINIYPVSSSSEAASGKEGILVNGSSTLNARSPHAHTPWVLNRLFLLGLMLVFLSLIVVLEVLYYVSNHNQGISTSTESKHYLWTYGPTAVFSIFAVFWSKIEYHTKLLMPWKLLSTKPQRANDSLLLDYVSPNQAIALYRSIRAGHYPVAVATVGSLIIIAATVVSTGLFVLQQLPVSHHDTKMILQDQFSLNLFNASLVDTVPILLAFGLLGNLSMAARAGTNKDYAVQSFNLTDHIQGTNLTITTTADTFSADLECSVGQMTNATLVADSVLDQVLVNLTAGSCNTGQSAFAVPDGSASEGVFSFGRMLLLQCLDDVEVADKRSAESESTLKRRTGPLEKSSSSDIRVPLSATSTTSAASKSAITTILTLAGEPTNLNGIEIMLPIKTATITVFSTPSPTATSAAEELVVIAFAQFSHPKDFPETQTSNSDDFQQNFTTIPLSADDLNATVLFCKPTYRLGNASVTLDASGSLLDVTQLASNDTSTGASIPAWDMVMAFQNSLSLSLQALEENTLPVEVADGWVTVLNTQWDPFFNFLQAISPSRPISEFLDSQNLEGEVRQFFKTSLAQIAKLHMTDFSNLAASGSYKQVESRLVVHEISLRLSEVLLIALAACALAMVFIRPTGLTPGDPSALGRVATILSRSNQLMAELTQTGDQNLGVVQGRLEGLEFSVPKKRSEDWREYKIQPTPSDGAKTMSREDDKIEWWQPMGFKLPTKIAILGLPLVVIIALEVTYQRSRRSHGLGNVSDGAYIHFVWTLVPAALLTCLKLLLQTLAWSLQLLDPFRVLKDGNSNAKASLFSSHLRKSALELCYSSVAMRRFALLATALLTMIGPFLTIVVSGLFSTQFLPKVNRIDVGLVDALSLSPYNRDWQAGPLAVANLLIHGTSSYPDGTYDNIVYPNIDALSVNASFSNADTTFNATTLSVEMQSLRPNMSCIAIDPSHVFHNFTNPSPGNYDFALTYLELAGCNCDDYLNMYGCKSYIPSFGGSFQANSTFRGYFDSPLLQTTWTYPESWDDPTALLAAKAKPISTCPNITAFYADFEKTSINVTVFGCSWNLELVNANVTYDLQKRAVSSVQAGNVLDSTNAITSYPFQTTISEYMDGFVHTTQDASLPNIFMALLNGSTWNETFTPENAPSVAESLQFIYNTFAAQYLNTANRAPVTAPSSSVGNMTNIDRERLVQSGISTRILEGLLAAMWLCAVVAFVLFDSRELLPKNPCSVAAQASLFADSELLDLVPHGTEWLSDDELLQTRPFRGYFFSLGYWGNGPDGSRRRFGVDVGKAEGLEDSR